MSYSAGIIKQCSFSVSAVVNIDFADDIKEIQIRNVGEWNIIEIYN